jgi:hypothetical protein
VLATLKLASLVLFFSYSFCIDSLMYHLTKSRFTKYEIPK